MKYIKGRRYDFIKRKRQRKREDKKVADWMKKTVTDGW